MAFDPNFIGNSESPREKFPAIRITPNDTNELKVNENLNKDSMDKLLDRIESKVMLSNEEVQKTVVEVVNNKIKTMDDFNEHTANKIASVRVTVYPDGRKEFEGSMENIRGIFSSDSQIS